MATGMENDDESTTSMQPHSDVYTDDAPTGKLPAAAISDASDLLHAVDTNQNIIEPGAGALVLGSDTSLKDQHDGSNSELRLSETFTPEVEPETGYEGGGGQYSTTTNEPNYLTHPEDLTDPKIYTIQSWPGCRGGISLASTVWYQTAYPASISRNPSEETLCELYRSTTSSAYISEYELPAHDAPEVETSHDLASTFTSNDLDLRIQQQNAFPIWNLSQSSSLQFVGSFAEEQQQAAARSSSSEDEFCGFVAENNAAKHSNSYPYVGEIPDFALAIVYHFPSTSLLEVSFAGDENDEFDLVEERYNDRERHHTDEQPAEESVLHPQYYVPEHDHDHDHCGNGEAAATASPERGLSIEAVAGSMPETPTTTYEDYQPQTESAATREVGIGTEATFDEYEYGTAPTDPEPNITRRVGVSPRRYQMRLPELVYHYGDLLTFYGHDTMHMKNVQNCQEISSALATGFGNETTTLDNAGIDECGTLVNQNAGKFPELELILPAGQREVDPENDWLTDVEVLHENEDAESSEFPVVGYIAMRYKSDDNQLDLQSLSEIRNQIFLNVLTESLQASASGRGTRQSYRGTDNQKNNSENEHEFEPTNELLEDRIRHMHQLMSHLDSAMQRLRLIQGPSSSSSETEHRMGEEQGQSSVEVAVPVAGPSNEGLPGNFIVETASPTPPTSTITLSAIQRSLMTQMSQLNLLRQRLLAFVSNYSAGSSSDNSTSTAGGDADISSGTSSESSATEPESSTSTSSSENESTETEDQPTAENANTSAYFDAAAAASAAAADNSFTLRPRPPNGHRYTVSEFGLKGRRMALMSQPAWMPKYAHRLSFILSQYIARRETAGFTPDSTFSVFAPCPEESTSSTSTSSSSSDSSDSEPRWRKKRKKATFKHPFNVIRRAHFWRRGRVVRRRRISGISQNAAITRLTTGSNANVVQHQHPLPDSSPSRPISPRPVSESPLVQKQTSCLELHVQPDANNNDDEPQTISLHRIWSEVLQGDGSRTTQLVLPRRVGRSLSPSVDSIELSRRRIVAQATERRRQRPFYVKILRFLICKRRSHSP